MVENISMKTFSSEYRPDIDGLRSVAVVSVIFFHAFPSLFPAGFIGVDIFFVISGYLISNILLNNIDQSTFSLAKFYGRRILRLYPALLLVLVFCLALGWLLLLSDEYKQLGKHVVAGITFSSNYSLWQESGYFDSASERKILLHLWSLAIEEQFYLLWPILLWVAWKFNKVFIFISVAVLASFAANILTISSDLTGAFYLPQYRFWELSVGGVLAYARIRPGSIAIANSLSATGFLLLICGFFLIGKDSLFPGWWALLPTLGTGFIIASGNYAWLNRCVLSSKPMVLIGLISYPMYLWHWPLLVFARIYWGHPNTTQLIIAAGLSIPLAYLTFRFVEIPLRQSTLQFKSKVIRLVFLSALIGLAGSYIYLSNGLPKRNIADKQVRIEADLKWTFWDDKSCAKEFDISPCQITQNKPIKVLILGDSHANHLYPGISQNIHSGVMNIGSCAPLDGIQVFVSKNQQHHSGRSDACLKNNFSLLEKMNSIETVIVSMYSQPLFDGILKNQKDYEYWGDISLKSILKNESNLPQTELVRNGLLRTLNKVDAAHKKIIFVRDTPYMSEDFRDYCLKRKTDSAKSIDCTIPREIYELQRAKEADVLKSIRSKLPNIYIFDPIDLFCDKEVCYFIKDGRSLYRDHHHLSEYGSNIMGRGIATQYLKN